MSALTLRSYFDTPENLARLRAAARQLEGTPFFANSEAPGRDGGIDCAHTLNWLYRTTGVIGAVTIPPQTMDHGQHSGHSVLIEAFDTWPALAEAFLCIWRAAADDVGGVPSPRISPPLTSLLPGDALCFTAGQVPHHSGVMLEHGEVLHALKRPGVHRTQLTAAIRGRRLLGHLAAVYRPLPLAP